MEVTMLKRKCALLITSMMLAVAAPATSPALSVQAASYVQTHKAVISTSSLSGKFVQKNGSTYYVLSDGSNKTGWIFENGNWYYFSKKDSRMVTGWLKYGQKKYFLRKNGTMIAGPRWVTLAGKRYFFNKDGDVRAAWELISGKWYYRNADGVLYKNRWLRYADKYYYLTATGAAATGTKTVQGKKFKFSSNGDLLGTVPSYVIAAAKTGGSIASTSSSQKVTKESASSTASKPAASTADQTKAAAKTVSAAKTSTSTKAAGTEKTAAAKTDDTAKTTSTTKTTSTAKTTSSTKKASTAKSSTKEITTVTGKLNDLPKAKRNFVIQIANYVRKYAPKYGIKVYSPIIAQAIHESGWGESSLSAKYHNYFGLKCGTLWKGKSVNLSTKEEYSAGSLTTIRSNFRVYDNMEQGVKGYFEFIQLARYANLKGVTSPRQYLTNIKNDGYATGFLYVDHTMALVNMYNLTQFDK